MVEVIGPSSVLGVYVRAAKLSTQAKEREGVELMWSKRSYRWRCRLWFMWQEHVRDIWDFVKKPMIVTGIAIYPLIQSLHIFGAI